MRLNARRSLAADGPEATRQGCDLSPRDFRRIAEVVREVAGIALPEAKMALVQTRLARRLRALGLETFREYCPIIEGGDAAARRERQELISAITTNVTQFFREAHHFEDLRTRTLPPLIERARRGGRVRIWSAGCSTGEEPYSIALTLLGLAPDAVRLDVRILATDLDRAVIETASRGVYPERLMRGVPASMRKSCFEAARDGDETAYSVGPAARRLIAFKALNLTRPLPMQGGFDVIFCRNVVIYFDAATELGVWKRLSERLAAGGRLYIGHSERVNTWALPVFESDGVTTYRRI